MKRVKEDGSWSLFCPHEAPNLSDCYGKEFEDLYIRYEKEGRAKKTIKLKSYGSPSSKPKLKRAPLIFCTKTPLMKSLTKNLGTIKSSNLCTEIMEYTSPR